MGGCQGTRKNYPEKTQKECREFEDRQKMCDKDWKLMTAFVRCYSQHDGKVPEENILKIMEEMGLKDTYNNNDTKLKTMLNEFIGEEEPQNEFFVYFVLFMCGGRENEKATYFCMMLNDMDSKKNEVSGARLRKVLEKLMHLAIMSIPEKVGKDKMDFYDEMIAVDVETMVKLWCPGCEQENVPNQMIIDWFSKDHSFTTGEARAVVLKNIKAAKAHETLAKAKTVSEGAKGTAEEKPVNPSKLTS